MSVPLFAFAAGVAARPVRTVYVLGAGSSAEGGVPLSSQILPVGLELRRALRERGGREDGRHPYLARLGEAHREAFDRVYEFIAGCVQGLEGPDALDPAGLPTVDELWALLELAREHRARFGCAAGAADVGRVRRALMVLLYHVLVGCRVEGAEGPALRVRFGPGPNPYGGFVRLLGPDDAVIALNYDTLLEGALREVGRSADYGIATDRREEAVEPALLVKPHGSFNWLYCPTCGALNDFGCRDVARVAIELDDEQCACPADGTPREYVIVPPSLVKNYSNPHLSQLWAVAAMLLRSCERVVFCGVSMADSDIYFKYLIKQATSLNPRLREGRGRLVVVNRTRDDVLPYVRLFGPRAVKSVIVPFSEYVEREAARAPR
ncbi:MAG TPA: SIR2 family protein [Polyangiaceae bacterium]|nr:SIR2 family protein [Polyangiaceae bacterium]